MTDYRPIADDELKAPEGKRIAPDGVDMTKDESREKYATAGDFEVNNDNVD